MSKPAILVLLLLCTACGSGSPSTIVLGWSIGAVRIGESRSDVQRALGDGVLVSTQVVGSGSEPRTQVSDRLYGQLLVTYFDDRVGILDTRDPRYRTPAGLGVGAPWRRVLALSHITSSLGRCTMLTEQCQHGGDPADGGRLTVFFNGPGEHVSRVVVTAGN